MAGALGRGVSLVGVVKAAAGKGDGAGLEDVLAHLAVGRAQDLRLFSHRVLYLEDEAAFGAAVVVTCHTSPFIKVLKPSQDTPLSYSS